MELAGNQSRQYEEFKILMEHGLRLLDAAPAARRERLEDVHALYDWLAREMPAVWARWEQERKKR